VQKMPFFDDFSHFLNFKTKDYGFDQNVDKKTKMGYN